MSKKEMTNSRRGKTAFICGSIGLVLELFNLFIYIAAGQIANYMVIIDLVVLALCVFVMVKGWRTMHTPESERQAHYGRGTADRPYNYTVSNGSSQPGKNKKKKNPYKKKK